MRRSAKRRHACGCVCYVVPPFMLKEVAKNGDDQQKAWAIKSLALTERHRGRREVMATIPADISASTGGLRRTIYDAQSTTNLPGTIVRGEGAQPVSDPAVNEAYDAAGSTYDMYQNKYQRISVDNKGLRLDSTVHYDRGYDNAFWDGRQMVYGDGDGRLFNRFTLDPAVIGHELTHGVTQYEAGLVYFDQSGALNEHMSDVFGSLVKQFINKTTVQNSDWLIGAGLLTAHVRGIALRSMRNPGTAYNDPVLGQDPQPDHMKKYVQTDEDNGGVHINSGIPNKAFYLVAEQLNDSFKAGKIWYVTLCDRLKSRSTFKDAAAMTAQTAASLFGTNGKEHQAVRKAWGAVGIKVA